MSDASFESLFWPHFKLMVTKISFAMQQQCLSLLHGALSNELTVQVELLKGRLTTCNKNWFSCTWFERIKHTWAFQRPSEFNIRFNWCTSWGRELKCCRVGQVCLLRRMVLSFLADTLDLVSIQKNNFYDEYLGHCRSSAWPSTAEMTTVSSTRPLALLLDYCEWSVNHGGPLSYRVEYIHTKILGEMQASFRL